LLALKRQQSGRYRLVRFQPKKHGSRLTAPNDRRAMREGLIKGGKLIKNPPFLGLLVFSQIY